MPELATVLICGQGELKLDYLVPTELAGDLATGHQVVVPLRGRESLGIVVALHQNLPPGLEGKLRPIARKQLERPLLPPILQKLGEWLAEYYLAPINQVYRTMLPKDVWDGGSQGRGERFVRLAGPLTKGEIQKLAKRAPSQGAVLEYLLDLPPEETVPISELPGKKGGIAATVKRLEEMALIVVTTEHKRRNPFEGRELVASSHLKLNPEQEVALEDIERAVREGQKRKPILLLGVTGSGKTEVYLQAIDRALDRGESAILLVPEISLTPQTAERLRSRFSKRDEGVAILHSHLSDGERHDEWLRIHKREAKVVIGARSAIFAPLENVGIIVVDEEHESSYKQESVPRYHARDIAVLRAKMEDAVVVLGSATPSLESFHNAQRGKYFLSELKSRVDDRDLPFVQVIDLRKHLAGKKEEPGKAILSNKLRDAIEKRLAEKEQVILFLNRRGYSRSVQCLACGHIVGCPDCSVTMTYHLSRDRLCCHMCGHQQRPPKKCPKCGDHSVNFPGSGTERVEEGVSRMFPRAKIARVDADTMARKGQLEATLDQFRARKLDMLIGTQMIAKGLHFPNVTLVGVLHADLGLHVPDFRAAERVFQLLTQVAGRAGRGDLAGEVIVQTFSPESPAIQYARHQDFFGFAEQELNFREMFRYPPFYHALLCTARAEEEKVAAALMEKVAKRLQQLTLPETILVGRPGPSPIEKVAGQYRYQLMIRAAGARPLQEIARRILPQKLPANSYLTFDMDPYSLL